MWFEKEITDSLVSFVLGHCFSLTYYMAFFVSFKIFKNYGKGVEQTKILNEIKYQSGWYADFPAD